VPKTIAGALLLPLRLRFSKTDDHFSAVSGV
jgi:hypothetical protein